MYNESVPKIINLFNLKKIVDLADNVEKLWDLDTQTELSLVVLLGACDWQAVVKQNFHSFHLFELKPKLG